MSVGSVFSAAAPVAGGIAGSLLSPSQSAQTRAAGQSLVRRQANPLFTSRFDPGSGFLSLTPTARASRFLEDRPLQRLNLMSGARQGEFRFVDPLTNLDLPDVPTGFALPNPPDLGKPLNVARGLAARLQEGTALTNEELQGLLDEVRPGFGRFTEAVERTIEAEGRRATSDLRSDLSRRRLLGSSFASDAEARVGSEFANRARLARSEATLAEIDTSRQILQQQLTNISNEVQTGLAQVQQEIQTRLAQAELDLQRAIQEAVLELQARELKTGQEDLQARMRLAAAQQRLEEGRFDLAAEAFLSGEDQQIFERLLDFGNLSAGIAGDIQGAFQRAQEVQQDLAAQAARGAGAAVGTAFERFGRRLDQPDAFRRSSFGGGR